MMTLKEGNRQHHPEVCIDESSMKFQPNVALLRSRIKWALVLCASLSACSPGGCVIFNHPFAADGGSCRIVPYRFEKFLTVGEEYQFEFGLDEGCSVDIQEIVPTRLTADVEVRGPDGKSVMFTAQKPERR